MLVTLDTSHFDRSPLNATAPENIWDIVVALDRSHFETSPLNEVAPQNIPDMSVVLDTSHDPIGPFGPRAQSPTGEIVMHASTAVLSSARDREINTAAAAVEGVCITIVYCRSALRCTWQWDRGLKCGVN